jgi:hypothetical protein
MRLDGGLYMEAGGSFLSTQTYVLKRLMWGTDGGRVDT